MNALAQSQQSFTQWEGSQIEHWGNTQVQTAAFQYASIVIVICIIIHIIISHRDTVSSAFGECQQQLDAYTVQKIKFASVASVTIETEVYLKDNADIVLLLAQLS